LITGEDPNFISKTSVDKVIELALVFNAEASREFGPTFQNEREGSFELHQNHRARLSRAIRNIINAFGNVYNRNRNGQVHRLNIIDLLASFTTDTNNEAIEKAKKLLFVKKVILGGENEVITHYELERMIHNFDRLTLIALDIVRYKYILLDQASILHLLKVDVDDLDAIVTQGSL